MGKIKEPTEEESRIAIICGKMSFIFGIIGIVIYTGFTLFLIIEYFTFIRVASLDIWEEEYEFLGLHFIVFIFPTLAILFSLKDLKREKREGQKDYYSPGAKGLQMGILTWALLFLINYIARLIIQFVTIIIIRTI